MSKRGFTLVEIMIVVAIIALLAAIAVPNLLRARQTSAEATTQATLKSIATALEVYMATNNGSYCGGNSLANLTGVTPPYIGVDYCAKIIQSYSYNCRITTSAYSIRAIPIGFTNAKTYVISTGAVLSNL